MEYGLLGIRRIRLLLGNFWREIQRGRPRWSPGFRLEDVVVLRSPPPRVFRFQNVRAFLLEIEIPCILLFLNWNRNSQNSPKRMHPQFIVWLNWSKVKRSILIGSLSGPNFAIRTAKMDRLQTEFTDLRS